MSGEHATPHPGDADDGEDHGDDDHGHESEALGPLDVYAWGAFALGTGLGLVVAVCIAVATGDRPA